MQNLMLGDRFIAGDGLMLHKEDRKEKEEEEAGR